MTATTTSPFSGTYQRVSPEVAAELTGQPLLTFESAIYVLVCNSTRQWIGMRAYAKFYTSRNGQPFMGSLVGCLTYIS